MCYLGYMVSQDGIKPDPTNTKKVCHYPRPRDATEVRRFLGLASYYRRFIPRFATVVSPLHALIKKDAAFQWTPS